MLTDSFPIPTDGVPYEIGRNLRRVMFSSLEKLHFVKKNIYQTYLIYYLISFFIYYRLSPSGKYLPVMRVDFMSLRINNLVRVTTSTESMNLTLKYSPISLGKFRYQTFLLYLIFCFFLCDLRVEFSIVLTLSSYLM